MALTQKDMQYLCKLAKIQPSDEKLAVYAPQCEKILDYMNELEEIDTIGIEPLYSPVLHKVSYRNDVANETLSREEVLLNAPNSDGQYFIVPKIVEEK